MVQCRAGERPLGRPHGLQGAAHELPLQLLLIRDGEDPRAGDPDRGHRVAPALADHEGDAVQVGAQIALRIVPDEEPLREPLEPVDREARYFDDEL